MSVRYTSHAAAAKRLSWFILFSVGVALTVTLFYVKTRAQSARADVTRLTQQIEIETAAIQVLRAELAVLDNPVRLSTLSTNALGLAVITPEQSRTVSQISDTFALTPPPDAPVEEVRP